MFAERSTTPAVARTGYLPRRFQGQVAHRVVALGAVAVVLTACGTGEPPEPPAPEAEPGVEWSAGFESGSTDEWRYLHEAEDDRINVVDDQVREGRYAVRLTGDGADLGPDEPVRAQLDGPVLFQEGDEAFISFSTMFPDDIPPVPEDGWFVFFQFHGAPFGESPPLAFDLAENDGQQTIGFARGEQYDFDTPWSMPLRTGEWIDFTAHVKFSADESIGFLELWVNGEPQQFTDGSTRLATSTILPDQEEGLFPIATNYYKEDSIPGPVSVYHDAIRVGDSFEAVAPRS